MKNRCFSLPLLLVTLTSTCAAAKDTFQCRWTESPVTIDGHLEDAWKSAELIEQFYLPWLPQPRASTTKTQAMLLWDREYLYFSATLEDHDLFADITEHDGRTWHNDVFELFLKPAQDKTGYYEFHVSAAGTIMDVFLPRREPGGFQKYVDADEFHIEAKVQREGTLNQRQDRDRQWTVEGRIPWTDLLPTGGRPALGETWNFAICRYDYSEAGTKPELSTCAPLTKLDFHQVEKYATLVFRGPGRQGSSQAIQDWKPLQTSRVVGSPDPPLPYQALPAFPHFKLSFPLFMMSEPGSRNLYFIDQPNSNSESRLCRTSSDPALTGDYDVLLEFENAVAYSMCFHPRFAENGYLFVGANGSWNKAEPKKSRVVRYTVSRHPPYRLDSDSATTIIQWESDGHNGAAVAFGLDGMLYVTSGDGTSDSDDNVTGQGLDHLLAKVLRIDVDRPDPGRAYSVPADNPFVGQAGIAPETWAYGLRNPWRITVDPRTGHVWVGNNGQDLWEQAYLVRKGDNYGWSVFEGSHPFYLNRKLGPHPHVKPTVEHPHSEARSLTGGVVYHGARLPELSGAYIYGDHSTGKIWGVKHDGDRIQWHRELADTSFNISAIALDADGELLIADHRGENQGGFYQLRPSQTSSPGENVFPRKLSDSGLFQSVQQHRMSHGLIPYSVNAPLWSDGAFKARWIALPPAEKQNNKTVGARIEMTSGRGWNFPDRTVLVKSFGLELIEGDPASRRWIETRFLTRQQGEWVGYSYAWNDQQTEGHLVAARGKNRTFKIRTADGGQRAQTWRYPSRAECMVCHSRAANYVLGLSTLQFNKDHDYGQVVENQLRVLEQLDLLRVDWKQDVSDRVRGKKNRSKVEQRAAVASTLLAYAPEHYHAMVDPFDKTADLELRARSYLHANCAACHIRAGGGNAQMELEFGVSRQKMNVIDVEPLHDRFGMEQPRLIAPGAPNRSVLLHRMSIRQRGQMPQLSTTLVDRQAVALVRAWIESLSE